MLIFRSNGYKIATGNGVAQPGLCLFFGDLIDAVAGEPDQLMDELEEVFGNSVATVFTLEWRTHSLIRC
eukprot:6271864-Amphidinium_carterae.1